MVRSASAAPVVAFRGEWIILLTRIKKKQNKRKEHFLIKKITFHHGPSFLRSADVELPHVFGTETGRLQPNKNK